MSRTCEARRILLVRPAAGRRTIGLNYITFTEPLDLEYLAAGLSGHHTRFLDLQAGESLDAALTAFKPEIVGLTGYITSVPRILEHCREIKAFSPRILTVVGGIHATTCPADFHDPAVDLIITGSGIDAFAAVASCWPSSDGWAGLQGLHIREGDGTFHTTGEPAAIEDPDLLPLPDRQLTRGRRASYYYLYYDPVALIRSSLSCSHRCSFCVCHLDNRGLYRARSVRNFVDEIKTVPERNLYIVDNDFLVNRAWLMEFAATCKAENVRRRYVCFGRSDFIAHHPDVMEKLAGIGLEAIIVGHEFLADTRLDAVRKRNAMEANVESVRVLRRHGIDTLASFIIPQDVPRDYFGQLQDYIFANKIGQIVLQTVTPLPGTEWYTRWQHQLLTRDRDLFDMSHVIVPYAMGARDVYRGLADVYTRSVLDPRRITSLGLKGLSNLARGNQLRLIRGSRAYLSAIKAAERLAL